MTAYSYTFDTPGDNEGWTGGTVAGGALTLTESDSVTSIVLTDAPGAEVTATITATVAAGTPAQFALQAGPALDDNALLDVVGTGESAVYTLGPRVVTEFFNGQFAVTAILTAVTGTLSIESVVVEVGAGHAPPAPLFPYGETVIRQRARAVLDPYSSETTSLDWTNPSPLEIPGCAFDPGSSDEPLAQGRNAVVTQPRIFAATGVDVDARDRIVVRGRVWQVDGDPADFRHPMTGWRPGVVINLKAVSG